MKKRKFNLVLNIATLCLAAAAIVFGVYSANQAKMNINGSLGFTAHYVSATVTTKLEGSASTSNGTQETKSYSSITFDKADTTTTKSLDLGIRYFTQKGVKNVNEYPAPVKAKFTIKNTSSLAIKATINLPDAMSNVDVVADKEAIKINKDGQGVITVTFSVSDPLTSVSAISFKNFNITLEPCAFDRTDIDVYYDASTSKPSNYYIKYGTSGGTELKWYIIGTQNASGALTTLAPSTDFATTLSTDGEFGKILKAESSVTYAFISENALSNKSAVVFNNRGYKDTDVYYNTYYDGVKANDYATSTIREYLNGKTINNAVTVSGSATAPTKWQPNTTTPNNINFYTQNVLKGSSATDYDNNIYALIKTRSLQYLYADVDSDALVASTDTSIIDYTDGISATDSDAFWLLSHTEANDMFNNSTKRDCGSMWWLRNGQNDKGHVGGCVMSGSLMGIPEFSAVYKNNPPLCVRPAFLI